LSELGCCVVICFYNLIMFSLLFVFCVIDMFNFIADWFR
jgi:hypothetical protein